MPTPAPLDPAALYRVLAENAPDPILVIDESSRIVAVNPAAERMFGYAADEMVGESLHMLMPERLRAGHDTGMRRYLATGRRHVDWRGVALAVRTRSGAELPVEISFGEIVTGGHRLFAGFVRDMSERVAREAALKESENRFRAAADVVPILMWTARPDGHRDWFNAAWLAFTGHSMEEELGSGWTDSVHPDDVPGFMDAYTAAMHTRTPFTLEYRLRRHDGEWRWVIANGVPRYTSDGTFVGFVGSCTDATEQRRTAARVAFLSEASRVLSTSLEVAPTLQALARLVIPELADYCHVDLVDQETGELRRVATAHVNPEKQRVLEQMSREYPPETTPGYATVRAVRSGRSRLVAYVPDTYLDDVARDEGHLQLAQALAPSSFVVSPLIARGRVIGAIILVATPESGRHYGPEDLVMVEDLAGRVAIAVDNARLYEESERARAAAVDASRAKSIFLATMSHELRTPLNAIGGYAELLQLGIRGPVTSEQQDDLQRIRRSQRHLLGLVNDVLDIARLESGAFELRADDVPVNEILADLDALVRPQAAAKGITPALHGCDPMLRVRADRDRVLQILVNLLSNSIKFTPPGGYIRVGCGAANGTVEIQVADTGPGIPADQLERIFEPFTQVHEGLTRPVEGTGLGLAISRDLARAMGGDLRVAGTSESGATLVLTLPRGGAAPRPRSGATS